MKPTGLTPEQEAIFRANTTKGDPYAVHSASVAAWRNVWALLDSARASLETEREMRQSLESSLANLAVIARGGDPNLPVSGPCVVVRDELAALRRNYESVVDSAQRATESECARWQKRLNFLHVEYGVDGSGCDSGDPLDLTEDEVRQVIESLRAKCSQAEQERDEALAQESERGVMLAAATRRLVARRKALAAAQAENANLLRLLHPLVVKWMDAEAREDLPEYGADMEAAMRALPICSGCAGSGAIDKVFREDVQIPEEVRCAACGGWGLLARPMDDSALRELVEKAARSGIACGYSRACAGIEPGATGEGALEKDVDAIVSRILGGGK